MSNLYGTFFKSVPLTYLDLQVKERTIANLIQSIEGGFDIIGDVIGDVHSSSTSKFKLASYINTLHLAIGNIGVISPEEPFGEVMNGYVEQFQPDGKTKEFLLTLKPTVSDSSQLTTPLSIQASKGPVDEVNAIWVYKSSLKDLKSNTDFTVIGRRLVFYKTILSTELTVKYDGQYPTFGRQESGFRPNIVPQPTLIDSGKVKRPVLTRLANGRIRVKVEASAYNQFATSGDPFGKKLSPKFSSTIKGYIGPGSVSPTEDKKDVISPWIKRSGLDNEFRKLKVSGVYVVSELEYEIELDSSETIDLVNDTVVMQIANISLSEMIRDLYHFMKNHTHSSFDASKPILHSEIGGLVPTQEKSLVKYSPSTMPGNDHPQYLHREGYRQEDPGTYNNALIGDLFVASKYNGDGEDNGSFFSNLDGDSNAIIFGDANDGQKIYRRKQSSSLLLTSKQNGLEINTTASISTGKTTWALKLEGHEIYNYTANSNSPQKLVIQSKGDITRFQRPVSDFTPAGLGDIEVRNIYISGNIIPLTGTVQIGQPANRIAAIYTNELTAGKETVGTPGIPGVATVYTQPILINSWELIPNTDVDVDLRGFYRLRILKSAHKAGEYPQVVGHFTNEKGQREQMVFHKVVTLSTNASTGDENGDMIIYASQPVSGYIKVF